MRKKNVFVFGLNDANRAQMHQIPDADSCAFHSLLAPGDVVEAEAFDFGRLLDRARRQLHAFKGQSPLSVGLFGGKWCSYSTTPDLPRDQRVEDGGALVFDTEPMGKQVRILGAPLVELDIESNRPVAMVAVRLSDVSPEDVTTRITYGLLNLCHRDSHEHPTPLEPGERYRVRISLDPGAREGAPAC